MLGALFAASEDELDEGLLDDGPFERLETVEAKGLTEMTFATLGEILGLGRYDSRDDEPRKRGGWRGRVVIADDFDDLPADLAKTLAGEDAEGSSSWTS